MSAQPPSLPSDFEELDFVIEEEVWNEYELVDNSRIKARIFLNKIMRHPQDPNNHGFNIQPPVYVVYSPPANRGEMNHAPQPQEYNSLQSFEVRTTRSDERWNMYRILRTGQTVKLKLSVSEIRRVTDRFADDGLPFYLVTAAPSVLITPSNDKLKP
jgi:hypothetical protein